MKCKNCFNCNGRMVIRCQHDRHRTYVAAHDLPVFAQCSECGYAPGPVDQPHIVALLLVEFIGHGGYKRDAQSLSVSRAV